jgi:hypothetical protein
MIRMKKRIWVISKKPDKRRNILSRMLSMIQMTTTRATRGSIGRYISRLQRRSMREESSQGIGVVCQ